MKDSDKTKEQLINELEEMRQGITKLEASEAERKQAEEALKESEERYRVIFESVNDAIVRLDKYGKIIDFNDRVSDILGYTRDEVIGKDFAKAGVFSLKDLPLVLKLFGKAVRGNVRQIMEWSIRHKNGSMITIEASVRLVKKNGKIEGVVAILRDIAERKQAEEALRESEERFRTIFDTGNDGILLADLETRKFHIGNTVICQMLGYSLEEIKNLGVMDIHPKEDLPYVLEQFDRQAKGDITLAKDIPVKRKDGSVFYADVNSVPITLAGRTYLLGTFRDITERKQAEETLRESEEKYRAVFENTGAATAIVEQDTTISLANEECERLFGYSKEELEGKKRWTEFVAKEELERMKEYHQLRRKDPASAPRSYEFRAIDRKGNVKDVLITTAMIPGTKKSVASLIDITEQKKTGVERRELERRVQVIDRLASIGEMASGIAHEINNPLTGVVGFSELLMTKDLPEDLRKDVEIIHDGAKRVADIVKRLLTFARQHKPERTYTDINEIIESTLTLKKYSLKTSNIEVNTSLDAELPWTMADKGQLQQVFMNIIVNAETEMRKAHGRGKLIIRTEQTGNTIRISFKDDGLGIAKGNIGKIFDPFFTTREVGEGTGLGLSLSYGIIAEHQGRIYVESKAGKGAAFFIELPIIAEERQLGLAEPADELKEISGARILVVDDEPTILAFLKKVLGGEGYDVETVGSGKEALGMIKNERYGLILCDIKLPGLSGAELYEQIGKTAPSLQKRVIFITGDVISVDTKEFLKRTKVPYVTKPFDIAGLKGEVSRMLR